MTEEVIIEFIPDFTKLDAGLDKVSKEGKVDPAAFKAIQAAIDTTATDSKGLIKTFKDVAGASIKMGKSVEDAFGAGINDALKDAGVSLDQFNTALKKANAPAISLKKELLQLKEAMARMKAEGKDTGKEFDSLRQRAGKLSDAIADANAEIKNAGSDTRGLDNVVGSISALAGGYAALQGAQALFGSESEDLQKTLVKVNGAMALAQGLQVVYNATLKEGALTKLADSISTGAQSAATTLYTFVVGGATVATRVFRAALIATGIGAVVVLVLSLVSAMSDFGTGTEDATKAQEDLKNALDFTNTALDNQLTALSNLKNEAALLAKLEGKSLAQQYQQRRLFNEREIQLLKDKQKAAQNYAFDQEDLADKGLATQQQVTDAYKAWGDATIAVNNAVSKSTEDYLNEEIRKKEERKKNDDTFRKTQSDNIEKARQKELAAIRETIAANLKKDKDLEEQEKVHYDNESDIAEDGRAQLEAVNAKWDKLRAMLRKSSEDAAAQKKKDDEASAAADAAELQRKIRNANIVIALAEKTANIINLLNQAQTERDAAIISGRRKQVEEQLKAGVITQKAAEVRQKQIDKFEAEAKYKAAKREKQAAIFQAILAIPKAFLQGLTSAPPPYGAILGAIAAALAAAELAIISSKPVPKFFRGKKDSYAGPGEVADMGSEIVERNGRMFLYTKPTQTYLGATDKVYTAAETRQIMHSTSINTTMAPARQDSFDYDRFAKAIPASGININIDQDGIIILGDKHRARTIYMDRKYTSPKFPSR